MNVTVMPSSRTSRSSVPLTRLLPPPEPPHACFARQPVIDGSLQPLGESLSLRWRDSARRAPPPPSPYATSLLLSQTLLEAGLARRRPGCLFVEMDAPTLASPIADVLSGALGAIQLPVDVPVQEPLTRRVAQLHARGYRFALSGVVTPDDPRFAWLPMLSFVKLDATLAPVSAWAPVLRVVEQAGAVLIADRLTEPADYVRLKALGVRCFQGDLLCAPQEESPRPLPACDLDVIARVGRLLRQGAPLDALGLAAGADPALVIRLLMLQRLYAPGQLPPASLAGTLAMLPEPVLAGWLHVLRTCTFDLTPSTQSWSHAVREQIYNYRARLIGARLCASPVELEAKVFDLYRRLCAREPVKSTAPLLPEGAGADPR